MGKLIKCKTCGADIAKSANKCPRCGARIIHTKRLIVAFVIAIALFAAINLFFNSALNLNSDPGLDTKAIEISAKDLWKAYSDNQVNADNKYKNKTLAVSGTVTDIGKDIVTGNPCVSLDAGDRLGIYPIQCFFPASDKQSEKLAALKDGQTVTIIGKCTGVTIAHVQLTDCALKE